jgi:hypothetical protein
VAALGLVLVGGLAACGGSAKTPGTGGVTGGGGESTSQICTELTSQGQALESAILGSMGSLNLTDPSAAASAGPQIISSVKTALTQLVGVLHTEAGKASDSNLKTALNKAADELNTEVGKINSLSDLENLGNDFSDVSGLDSFCPNALGE